MPEPCDPKAVRQHLEMLARSGVSFLPRPAKVPEAAIETEPASQALHPVASSSEPGRPSHPKPQSKPVEAQPEIGATPLPSRNPMKQLKVLQQEVAACVACAELASTRTQTVFGVGNPQPRLCFMGEAPGADEDQQGIPFVGRAGQLLTKIIEACTLQRDDVYILNTIKCRPPGNRNPSETEAANCRGFLERQLDLLRPEFICCLGAIAAQNLLQTKLAVGKLRGQFHDFRESRVLVTYHPAYLLRNPAAKRDVWEDMQLLMREMGIQLPKS